MNRTCHQNYKYDIYEILHDQEAIEPRFIPQAMILSKTLNGVSKIVHELNQMFGNDYAVSISGKSKINAEGLKAFTDGKHRVAVTCKVGLEGYNNTNVTLCVFMRKIVTGKIMFSQFVGRCIRIKRGLPEINGKVVTDRTIGRVISYKKFDLEKQLQVYEEMDEVITSSDLVLGEDE